MKKVLMISYSFPPKGGGGVLRQTKFAKYLPQFDWQPFILTGKDYFFFHDEELLRQLPSSCEIFRVPTFDPRMFFAKNKGSDLISPHHKVNGNSSFGVNLLKFVIKWMNKLSVPDIYITWVPQAVYTGLKIVLRHKIDVIYSIDNPYSNHLVGLILKKITNLPWIVDFKDPWSDNIGYRYKKIKFISWFDYGLEKLIISNCDVCISVYESILDKAKKLDFHRRRDKFYCLTNGFDREDFIKIVPRRLRNGLTITYTGILYKDLFPKEFFIALGQLIKEGVIDKSDFKFLFAGFHQFPETRQDTLYKRLLEIGIIDEVGFIPHRDCVNYIVNSDVLLLGMTNSKGSDYLIPSKIFEYLATGKMILALTYGDSAVAKLIKKAGSVKIIPFDNIPLIKEAILDIYKKYKENRLPQVDNRDILARFERKLLCGKLADIFDREYRKERRKK